MTDVVERPGTTPARSLVDLAVAGYALGLLVLWAPSLYWGLLTPRVALVFVASGPGLVTLAVMAWRGDRAARWAVGLLAWLLVTVACSVNPRTSLLGSMGEDRGWLYVLGALSSWALGRRVSTAGRQLVQRAIVLGLGVNVLVAVLQAVFKPTGALRMIDQRVVGLTPNAVMLGGLVVGALGLLGRRAVSDTRWVRLVPLAVVLGAVANLSGSRAAVGVGLLVLTAPTGWAAWRSTQRARVVTETDRTRRPSVVPPMVLLVAVVVGVALSATLHTDASSMTRSEGSEASSGIRPRLTMWVAGLDATVERPLVGWGPGQFRAATSTRVTSAFARAEGPDRLYFDAHNIAVEILTTTGVIGLGLSLGFLGAAARRASGPLAWFALGIGTSWLLTPASTVTAPLALLALGASSLPAERGGSVPTATVPVDHRLPPPARVLGALLGVVGLLAGMRLLVADHLVDTAASTGDPTVIERAQRLLPPDVVLASVENDLWRRRLGGHDAPEARRGAIRSARRGTKLDPRRPIRGSSWASPRPTGGAAVRRCGCVGRVRRCSARSS